MSGVSNNSEGCKKLRLVLVYDQNQDQVSVSVSEPKLFLPKPKLPPFSFPQIFLMLFVPCFEYFPCHTELSCKCFSTICLIFIVCISELLN